MSVTEITDTRQYLTFKLADEVFAIEVSKVREVLDFTTITKIPRTPDFMSGVINLLGNVVPVGDLRLLTAKDVYTRFARLDSLSQGQPASASLPAPWSRRGLL